MFAYKETKYSRSVLWRVHSTWKYVIRFSIRSMDTWYISFYTSSSLGKGKYKKMSILRIMFPSSNFPSLTLKITFFIYISKQSFCADRLVFLSIFFMSNNLLMTWLLQFRIEYLLLHNYFFSLVKSFFWGISFTWKKNTYVIVQNFRWLLIKGLWKKSKININTIM